jgi:hypothetical protein
MSSVRFAIAFSLVLSGFVAGNAAAADGSYDEGLCADGSVLGRIHRKIDDRYRNYIGMDVGLVEVVDPNLRHESERDDVHKVGRQFCHAKVLMTDGRKRDMWYLIERPWGFAGMPYSKSVEFCISGLDPWHVYGQNCSTVR